VLQEKGFATDFCDDARSGFERACDTVPDAVVCSIVLPDIDGFWVARRIRTEVGAISKTPLLLVGDIADKDARIQGLQVGADVLLERPVTNEEIVAQVEALVSMARRFRGDVPPEEQSAPSLAAAFRGDLSNFPLASVLMMLEMERRTGSLDVTSGAGKRALFVLNTGLFAHTELGGEARAPLEVLRDVLSWRTGRFAFRPRDVGSLPPPEGSIGALVLEAMRLEDERNAAS
jgi:CheY-like chemotaxis protein